MNSLSKCVSYSLLSLLMLSSMNGCANNETNSKTNLRTPEPEKAAPPAMVIYKGEPITPKADYICGMSDRYILRKAE